MTTSKDIWSRSGTCLARQSPARRSPIVDELSDGGVSHSHSVADEDAAGMINLDFDAEDRLLGIEVIGASEALPAELLDRFANRNLNPR